MNFGIFWMFLFQEKNILCPGTFKRLAPKYGTSKYFIKIDGLSSDQTLMMKALIIFIRINNINQFIILKDDANFRNIDG